MKILEMAHGIIWGPWTVGIFLIVGLVLSVRCHFFSRYWDLNIGGSQPGECLWKHGRGHDERQLIMQGILESRNSSQSVLPWRQR